MGIHPAINWIKASEQTGCHTPLISDYSSMRKCLLAHECDIALGGGTMPWIKVTYLPPGAAEKGGSSLCEINYGAPLKFL